MKNIVLCGFMGSGKSTVGKALADATNRTFTDTDHYIEEQNGCSVAALFETRGEAAFRAMETEVCHTLGARCDGVIAVGGGTVLNPENVAALRENGILVYLDISADCVLARLRNDNTRPLLQRADKDLAVRRLLQEREPFYRAAADVIVDGSASADRVAQDILAKIAAEIR